LEDLKNNLGVCPICFKHLKIKARERIQYITDTDTFEEFFGDLKSNNILDFPDYDQKLNASQEQSSENEAVITGVCKINGIKCCIFAMEPFFMMGSMGVIVGEKITRLFEYASEHKLSVIGFTISGGARMQEGMLSLMQMAKVSAAVNRHSKLGLLYLVVLCDPTAGGVTASFAMGADIIAAEPEALICFAGPRVIEQTIRQKLPPNFQKAEFLLKKGFVDIIVPRRDQKKFLSDMLEIHQEKNAV
jgi:acetyl-CoA carboxylase carboxyl transferase beta subunit